MTSLDSLPVRYAVAAVRQLDGGDVFCGLKPIGGRGDVASPYVLAVDKATEAALTYQVGVHVRTPNHKRDGVALVGVIVGGGHPAVLLAPERDGSLRPVREVDTTIVRVEVAGPDYRATDGEPAYGDIFLYNPRQAASLQRRAWWQFWRRG
jgi:hypothetical protein